MASTDQYIDTDCKLLLHCNGSDASTTFTDSEINTAKTMTAIGNAQIDTGQSKFGGAAYQGDGTGDGLTTPYSTDFNLGTSGPGNDFTIDFWVRFNGSPTDCYLVGNTDGSSNGWNIEYSSGALYVLTGSGTSRNVSWSPSADTWYHIAMVRSSTIVTIYAAGTSLGTISDGDFSLDSLTMSVAYREATGISSLNGWMDEVRIVKGTAVWTSDFTPPTVEYAPTPTVSTIYLKGRSRNRAVFTGVSLG